MHSVVWISLLSGTWLRTLSFCATCCASHDHGTKQFLENNVFLCWTIRQLNRTCMWTPIASAPYDWIWNAATDRSNGFSALCFFLQWSLHYHDRKRMCHWGTLLPKTELLFMQHMCEKSSMQQGELSIARSMPLCRLSPYANAFCWDTLAYQKGSLFLEGKFQTTILRVVNLTLLRDHVYYHVYSEINRVAYRRFASSSDMHCRTDSVQFQSSSNDSNVFPQPNHKLFVEPFCRTQQFVGRINTCSRPRL